jgi:hypothetical protein
VIDAISQEYLAFCLTAKFVRKFNKSINSTTNSTPYREVGGRFVDLIVIDLTSSRTFFSVVSNTEPLYRNRGHQTSIGNAANLNHPQTLRYLKGLINEGFLKMTNPDPVDITKSLT